MREILFRGKSVETGEWIYGLFVNDWETCYIFTLNEVAKGLDIGGYLDCCRMHEVIPETVGQYTGCSDKYGKKIFEGDIVRVRSKHLDYVIYVDGCFCMAKQAYCYEFTYQDPETLEVIGNIHDNPGLA